MNNTNQSPRYNNSPRSDERAHNFKESQAQYQNLIETTNSIYRGEYIASEQEKSDLARWALHLAKKELYPLQTQNALVHAGAVFADKGFRRYAHGVIEDTLQHTGDHTKWIHEATADTWHQIDMGVEAYSIGAVDLQSNIAAEERHGFYQEKVLHKTLAEKALQQQRSSEASEKAKALAASDSLGLETGAHYNPFADDREVDAGMVSSQSKQS